MGGQISVSQYFASLDPSARSHLDRITEPLTLSDGSLLIRQGERYDGLYVIISGGLRIVSDNPEGESKLVDMLGPDRIIGEAALLNDESAPYDVYARGETCLARVSRNSFAGLVAEFPEEAERIVDVLLVRLRRARVPIVLRLSQLFKDLPEQALADLCEELESVHLRRGERLIRQGEEGDDLYIVISGRLRVIELVEGQEITRAEFGCGETIGEIAILTGEPRSASVFAVRDAHVVRLSHEAFERMLSRHPRAMTRTFAGRIVSRLLQQISTRTAVQGSVSSMAVLAISRQVDTSAFCARLVDSLRRLGLACHLSSGEADRRIGISGVSQCSDQDVDHFMMVEWLGRQEAENDFLVYETDATLTSWTLRCLRQADQILLVGDAAADAARDGRERELLQSFDPRVDPRRVLVLLHADDAQHPRGTHDWLASRRVERHYHVRRSRQEDYDRLARMLVGRGIGLTFGGGFARGLAHVGVIRALTELGIPIDAVGGSSMGAIVAAQFSQGWDCETMLKRTSGECAESMRDFTMPFIAFQRGRKFNGVIRRFFGDARIEDMWIPFFCVSANLNRAELRIHTEGSLSTALLASARAPGVFPPVVIDGELHIDGGMLNNVPVDVMKSFCNGGAVIGVDVSPPHELQSVQDYGLEVNGWRALWHRLGPERKNRTYLPSILLVLMRTLEFSGISFRKQASRTADLYLTPPMQKFKRTDFHLSEEIAEAGYCECKEKAGAWLKGSAA